jgi:hypothetical protein
MASTYRGADGRIYSGIQILTVSDLLDGHIIDNPLQLAASRMPDVLMPPTRPSSGVVRANQQPLFPDDELTLLPPKARSMAKAEVRGQSARRFAKRR